jgi:hypothetical protein
MRVYDNGIYRDMTEEEIKNNAVVQQSEPDITAEERIEALEAAIFELAGVIFNG